MKREVLLVQSANDKILDAITERSIDNQRYSNYVVRRIISILNKSDLDIVSQLQKEQTTFTKKRLYSLLSEIRSINKSAYQKVLNNLDSELKGFAQVETVFLIDTYKKATFGKVKFITPSDVYAASLSQFMQGKLIKEWASHIEDVKYNRLQEAIRIGYTEGQTISQMVQRVRGTRKNQYKDGIIETDRRGAEAFVRTAVNHVSSVAFNQTLKSNSDIIKAKKWVSVLDGRTSAICQSRDGKIYSINSRISPPAHWNCRSRMTPVLKSWEELGGNIIEEFNPSQRTSVDGLAPADITYPKWLKGKSKEFQEDVLGVKKAQLFRSGKLSIDKFVNRFGDELTLKELQSKYPQAFK